MSDPNPYQPPQTPEPLKHTRLAKRGFGVAAILLLMPLAVGVAMAGSCAAIGPFLDAAVPPGAYGLAFVIGWLVFLTPPALTLIGMLWWAVMTHRRHRALTVERIVTKRASS